MELSRREFLERAGAVGLGFLGLRAFAGGEPSAWAVSGAGFGDLVVDPKGKLDLPRGFSYKALSAYGETMDDGLRVPAGHDGSASFAGPDGTVILIRNHELSPGYRRVGPFGKKLELVDRIPRDRIYDPGDDGIPNVGGTTTVVYDPARQKVVRHFLSLAGTCLNCCGGPTPWGSWLSCEETEQTAGDGFAKDHGWVFEVPAQAQVGLVKPVPLKALGRFSHEAAAVDPKSGVVYLTEDQGDGIFYRLVPKKPGDLAAGGRLEALMVRDRAGANTSNRSAEGRVAVGKKLAVKWLPLEEVHSPKSDLRQRGHAQGAATFSRGEGMWAGPDGIYFVSTNGGPRKRGQVWRYVPSEAEGTKGEARKPGMLELFIEPSDADVLDNADNITVAPWGDVYLCEDGPGENFMRVVSPSGEVAPFARNAFSGSEFAGANFSPDGKTLFVNIQAPGITYAITGPFRRTY